MKAFAKLAMLTLVAGLMTFSVGCSGGGDALPEGKSPEDIIKASLLMQSEITQSVFEMKVDADLKGTVDGEDNSLKGNMKLSGTTNMDAKTMQVVFSVDGNMNADNVKADLEIRANADGAFAKLGKVTVSDSDIQDMVDLFLADYIGNWTKLSFMTAEDVVADGYGEIAYSEGDVLPFKDIEYVGTKDILGLKSYQFHATLDESLVADMMAATGESVDTDQFLKAAEMEGDVYVAVAEGYFTGFEGSMKLSDPEMNGNVKISWLINPTKSDNVVTPSYDKELTEEDIAALMFGGAPMGTGAEFDDAAMMDDFTYDSDYDYADVEMDPELLQMMAEMENAGM